MIREGTRRSVGKVKCGEVCVNKGIGKTDRAQANTTKQIQKRSVGCANEGKVKKGEEK